MHKTILILLLSFFSTFATLASQPERGYRAFMECNMSISPNFGFLFGDPGDSEVFLGGSTSHGFQFNQYLYLGGGAGIEYNVGWHSYPEYQTRFIIPIFVEGRTDAKWGRFTPFLSLRIGANVADHGGIFFSPTVGYRFNWGRRCSINFGLGINLWGRKYTYPNYVLQPGGGLVQDGTYSYQGTEVKPAVRLGVDF